MVRSVSTTNRQLLSTIFAASLAVSDSFVRPSTTPLSSSGIAGSRRSSSSLEASASGDRPFAVIVQAEVEPDRIGEFLNLIETNAKETRKEPGCIRFDVLRSQEADNKFFFYELYRSADAIDYHKKQPHYNLWADFKASGGVISSTTHKTDGEFVG
jgi:quinol monooxygenase YgiN